MLPSKPFELRRSFFEKGERTFAGKDPGAFVLDEIVGYLLALAIYVAVRGDPTVLAHAACFFFFRAFDVLKTYPANRLEQLPGAPGIMLDDVAAASCWTTSRRASTPGVSWCC